MTRKDRIKKAILDAASTAARDFACYNRKEDSDLSADDIIEAVAEGWITIDQIVAAFRDDLVEWGCLREMGAADDEGAGDA